MEHSQPKDIKPKMRGCKSRSVNWQGALKQKDVKQGVHVLYRT
jgi:hypothetical protein